MMFHLISFTFICVHFNTILERCQRHSYIFNISKNKLFTVLFHGKGITGKFDGRIAGQIILYIQNESS